MMRLAATVLAVGTVLVASIAPAREWKDSTGTHSVEAELVRCNDTTAWLKKADGSEIPISLDKLSVVDREFLRGQTDQSEPAMRALSLPELVSKIEPAVVRIDTATGFGSGFVVDPSGIVVTNFHVVEGSRSATASFTDGSTVKVAGYLGIDILKDIAILKLKTERQYPALPVRKELPQKGESVATFGAPKGFDFSVSDGVVAAIRSGEELAGIGVADMVWIQTTAPISGGNSGGPLVDFFGRVVGINTLSHKMGQNINLAVSAQDITKLLRDCSGNPAQNLAALPGAAPPTSAITGGTLNSASDGFPLVRLPSGSALSYMNVQVPKDWPECNVTKETGVRKIDFPNGEPKSLHAFLNAKLHGPSLVLNEDGSKRWAADYYEGDLDGALRVWADNSQMTLFAEFFRGRRKGFICLFHENLPWLVQEWDKNSKAGEYLVKWNAGVPTVVQSDQLPGQAERDELAEAQSLLTQLEGELAGEQSEIKRDLAEWFHELDRQIKQARAGALNVQKRGQMLGAIGARGAAAQAGLAEAWRRALAK